MAVIGYIRLDRTNFSGISEIGGAELMYGRGETGRLGDLELDWF